VDGNFIIIIIIIILFYFIHIFAEKTMTKHSYVTQPKAEGLY